MAKRKRDIDIPDPQPKEVIYKIPTQISTTISDQITMLINLVKTSENLIEKSELMRSCLPQIFTGIEALKSAKTKDGRLVLDKSILLASLLRDNLRNGYYYQLGEVLDRVDQQDLNEEYRDLFSLDDLIFATSSRILNRRGYDTPQIVDSITEIENELLAVLNKES